MHRPDYEIYTFKRGKVQCWAFDVEYYGHYVAFSQEEIEKKVVSIKRQVAIKLREIEARNAAYYARLNQQTEVLLAELKAARENKTHPDDTPARPKKEIIRAVRDMLLMGATNVQILEAVPETNLRTISHVRHHMETKNML